MQYETLGFSLILSSFVPSFAPWKYRISFSRLPLPLRNSAESNKDMAHRGTQRYTQFPALRSTRYQPCPSILCLFFSSRPPFQPPDTALSLSASFRYIQTILQKSTIRQTFRKMRLSYHKFFYPTSSIRSFKIPPGPETYRTLSQPRC